MAKELGYYKDNNLDVSFLELQKNINPLQVLHDKKVDFALSNYTIAYQNKKLQDLTLIATYFQRSPLVLISKKEISSILGLKNKKIMLSSNEINNVSLRKLLYSFDINEQNTDFITQDYSIQHFINKTVDSISIFTSNELYELEQYRIPFNVIDPFEYGFETKANNLFTSHEKIKNNPEQVRNFLFATKKGWEYALRNIEATAKVIQEKYAKGKSLEKLIYEGKAIRELMLISLFNIGHVNERFVYNEYSHLIQTNKLGSEQTTDKLILNNEQQQQCIQEKHLKKAQDSQEPLIIFFLLALLFMVLIWSFRMHREIKLRKDAETKFYHQAYHDMLTGLPNRTLFFDRLSQAMKNADRRNEKIALFYIDLDCFKQVNDSYGHHVGDALLQEVAKILKLATRETDTVARMGGDEFIVIINNFSKPEVIELSVKKIMQATQESRVIYNQEINISMSIGIAIYPDHGPTSATLIKNADTAMYEAKNTGRNNYKYSTHKGGGE
ncbi:MAG: diguanylate cyclase [Sulfurimonas sp.]|nr:diguanylate cyclase [Sulfurimonas sp.]